MRASIHELEGILRKQLDLLPARSRTLLIKVFYRHQSIAAAAHEMKLSPAAARQRLRRILLLLRSRLRREYDPEDLF
jgi:DNA-directed RNA polymerase specialized sigma24 family protein